ncbi:alpha/beta fold hydrolase [Kitasatospora sp. NPDC058190]|uniref:alpha/beta fold hydrolase n=1 Tax=Kitasatospora sp. NPDC058190 TaxID=3346371 RepID=UPI0036DE6D78
MIDGRRLSYLDFGGAGPPLLALHGHLAEGLVVASLAPALGLDGGNPPRPPIRKAFQRCSSGQSAGAGLLPAGGRL